MVASCVKEGRCAGINAENPRSAGEAGELGRIGEVLDGFRSLENWGGPCTASGSLVSQRHALQLSGRVA